MHSSLLDEQLLTISFEDPVDPLRATYVDHKRSFFGSKDLHASNARAVYLSAFFE